MWRSPFLLPACPEENAERTESTSAVRLHATGSKGNTPTSVILPPLRACSRKQISILFASKRSTQGMQGPDPFPPDYYVTSNNASAPIAPAPAHICKKTTKVVRVPRRFSIFGGRRTAAKSPGVLVAAAVPRPGPRDVHPDALRQRLADGVHVAARLCAAPPAVAAPALHREGHVRVRPGFFPAAVRAKVVSGVIWFRRFLVSAESGW